MYVHIPGAINNAQFGKLFHKEPEPGIATPLIGAMRAPLFGGTPLIRHLSGNPGGRQELDVQDLPHELQGPFELDKRRHLIDQNPTHIVKRNRELAGHLPEKLLNQPNLRLEDILCGVPGLVADADRLILHRKRLQSVHLWRRGECEDAHRFIAALRRFFDTVISTPL